jgi:hypothetical protein
MAAIGPAVIGHLPQGALGIVTRGVHLRRGPHLPIPAEAEPVATSRKLADIADRAAADALGQLEDLGDCEYRAFGGVLLASATDAAGVARQDLVFILRQWQGPPGAAGGPSPPSIRTRHCRAGLPAIS